MASIFAHGLVGATLGKLYRNTAARQVAISHSSDTSQSILGKRFWILLLFLPMMPDLDVIGFAFGIPYGHVFGHRGITHGLPFALFSGWLCLRLFYRDIPAFSKQGLQLIALFSLATASHGLLDALTTGGHGIAFFSPFENGRYFLPWRIIQVSPIGIAAFFSEWGLRVIISEAIVVGVPCLLIWMWSSLWGK